MKLENFIRALIAELLARIGVDVAHHEIDLLLCVLSEICSLRNDPADQFMVALAASFLIRSTDIAVEHICSPISLGVQFDRGRV